ncbi:MAG: hypothetical protein WC775_06120 [Patescibacteria group bacterium]|jgi:hypothetical protein
MNTKIALLTGLVAVVLLALGGGAYVMNMKGNSKPNTSQMAEKNEKKNVFSSIKDALSKSLSLECTFTDAAGRKTVSYIKNGAVRGNFTGKTAQESGGMIMKDKKMYVWTGENTGFTMDLTDEDLNYTATSDNKPGSPVKNTTQQGNMLAELEKYKNNCKPAVVGDDLFVPPTNIEFSDFTRFMKVQPTLATEQMQPPTNLEEGMTQEQIQDLMKQYAPSGTP